MPDLSSAFVGLLYFYVIIIPFINLFPLNILLYLSLSSKYFPGKLLKYFHVLCLFLVIVSDKHNIGTF